jgi:uncharacterized membrane protein
MPLTIKFLGFVFDISELESYLDVKLVALEENLMAALTETNQQLSIILQQLDTLFETINSESQQIQDKIDSFEVPETEKEEVRLKILSIQEGLKQANTAIANFITDEPIEETPTDSGSES